MRLLVVTKPKHFIPPDAALGAIDATAPWADKNTAAGKIERIWSFAGRPGGGGIANVESLEELDAMMADFPFGAFYDIEISPIVDLADSLQRTREAITAALAARAAQGA